MDTFSELPGRLWHLRSDPGTSFQDTLGGPGLVSLCLDQPGSPWTVSGHPRPRELARFFHHFLGAVIPTPLSSVKRSAFRGLLVTPHGPGLAVGPASQLGLVPLADGFLPGPGAAWLVEPRLRPHLRPLLSGHSGAPWPRRGVRRGSRVLRTRGLCGAGDPAGQRHSVPGSAPGDPAGRL